MNIPVREVITTFTAKASNAPINPQGNTNKKAEMAIAIHVNSLLSL
nr:MAG TPA: hypothetical protein [Caudoviricetes sp.]